MNFETANPRLQRSAAAYNQHNLQNHYGAVAPPQSGLAIASMVLGIVGIVTSFFLVGLLFALVGLIIGLTAFSHSSKQPTVYGGRGFAIAGIVTSISTFALLIPIIAAITIPNLMASRRAANEASAISTLRTIYSAQQVHKSLNEQRCADVSTLAAEGLIDSAWSTGQKNGYRFEVGPASVYGCEIFASPKGKSDGRISYVISFDGVMRGADKGGLPADKDDPAVGSRSLD